MTSGPFESHSWSGTRWTVMITGVLVLQLGCIFFLSDRLPVVPRVALTAPRLRLPAREPEELLALEDPTLFALPHQQGFSGQAWLRVPPLAVRPFQWSEPLRWLPLPANRLGGFFTNFAQSETVAARSFEAKPRPEIVVPRIKLAPLTAAPSALRIQGDLAGRPLLTPFKLPSQTNSDLLTSSVVQVLVDARGRVLSATLLPPGSGLPAADQEAVKLAKSARFEPLHETGPGARVFWPGRLTLGEMVFAWQTVAPPPANAPAAAP